MHTNWTYRAVFNQVAIRNGHMVIGGQFGHHAFVLCIPVHSVKVWKVLEDVMSILSPVAQCPAAQLRPLR